MDKEYFKNLLNSRALKATPYRLQLLETMQQYQSAMPYSEIQKTLSHMDRVTLYRTLETLVGQGIIHQAYREEQETYYAVCGTECTSQAHQHNHIHFKCSHCQSVTCQELSDGLQIALPGYEIHTVVVAIEGICKTCR